MFYEELLKAFNDELKDIHLRISSPLEEANLVIALCTLSLAKFQKVVEKNGFQNIDKEINFFKSVKVIPMQYLIYYTELRSCELNMPKRGSLFQIQFLEKLEEDVNQFFNKHKEYIVYLELEHTLLDKYYYTRKYLNKIQPIKTYPYYKDPSFNTSRDTLLARIRAFELFVNYINQRKLKIENNVNDFIEKELIWSGTYAGFIEFVYGCQAKGYFNNGNTETSKIVEILGDFLGIDKGILPEPTMKSKLEKVLESNFLKKLGKNYFVKWKMKTV